MRNSIISIFISIIVILLSISVNITIAEEFVKADGKTKALFWLVEMGFIFKYYFLFGSLVSGILLFKAFRKKENQKIKLIALVLLLTGILSVVLKFWNWFV